MRIETAMNHRTILLQRTSDIYHSARLSGSTHETILSNIKTTVYDDERWARVPEWVRSAVTQFGSECLDRIYRPDLHAGELERALERAVTKGEKEVFPYVRWQLRVHGKHATCDEISAMREAGETDVWTHVEGAHIWNHKEFDTPFSGKWQKSQSR
jgi:hypothetical protein